MKKSVVVKMQQDFEARPIANLVQVANRYESKIYLEHGDSRVNAKSIMGMMSLTLMPGEESIISKYCTFSRAARLRNSCINSTVCFPATVLNNPNAPKKYSSAPNGNFPGLKLRIDHLSINAIRVLCRLGISGESRNISLPFVLSFG